MFITGCASGIGAHLATALARRGHRIVATDINEVGLAAQSAGARWDDSQVRIQPLDVRSETDWESSLDFAERVFGPIEVLMNVAGYLKPGYCHEIDIPSVRLALDVNVLGTILGTRAVAQRMVPRGTGHIVNIGSLASLAAVPGLCVYSASKFAVRGFTLAAAQELAPRGVRVSLVMPDAVATPMLDLQENYDEAALTFSGKRALTVEDIERVIVDEVLTRKPLEVTIPLSRGYLARIANVLPQTARLLGPTLARKGRRAQAKARAARG
jgi:NAD(P)-dependent dehydrogenase (short-subunit alcohol dehydrogenase family)